MLSRFVLSALLLSLTAPLAAHAAVATFQYNGVDTHASVGSGNNNLLPNNPFYTSFYGYLDKGSISFTYTGGPGVIALADVTSFSLTRNLDLFSNTTYPNNPEYSSVGDFGAGLSGAYFEENYSQSLSDLTGFSATVDASGNVTSLTFSTVAARQNANFTPNAFNVSTSNGVISYGTTTSVSASYPQGIFTAGTITQVVPEPASIGVLAVGVMTLAGRRRRI